MAKKEKKELRLDQSLKLLVKSSAVVFIAVILSKLFTYLYRIIIARHFGPEAYGLFTLALMVVGWFALFSTVGLTQGILRYLSIYRGKNDLEGIRVIFRKTSQVLLISGVITGFVMFFLSEVISIGIFHNAQLIVFLKILAIVVPLTILMEVYLSTLRAFERIGLYSFIFNIFQSFTKLATLAIFVFIGLGLNSIVWSYLAGILGSAILGYIACKKYFPEIFQKSLLNKKAQYNLIKRVYSYSWPLLFFGLVTSIFYWTDTFVVGYFKTTLEVGLYNAAVPIAALMGLTSELFMQLFFPLVTKEYAKKNFPLITEISKQVGKWIFIINLPILILMLLFPGVVINILFGSQYLAAENALRFLSIGMLFSSIFIVSNRLISIMGKSKIILVDIIIAAIINLVLNIVLVPRYGIDGAAFSTMTSIILLNLIFLFQSKKYLSIVPLRRKMFNISLLSIIPTVLLIYMKSLFIEINLLTLIFLGVVFLGTYIALIFLTKSLDRNDLMILSAIKQKISQKKLGHTIKNQLKN